MRKILKQTLDKFVVVDTDVLTESLMSAKELVLTLAQGVSIEGCRYSPNGLYVSVAGCAEFEVPVEVWKPSPLWNERLDKEHWVYEVSNLGNLRKYIGGGRYQIKSCYSNGGCYSAEFMAYGKMRRVVVAKVVATAFVPNPMQGNRVKFLDGDKQNCSAYNLAWRRQAKPTRPKHPRILQKYLRPIRQYNIDGVVIAEYENSFDVEKKLGIDSETICGACEGKSHLFHGYLWEFA